MTAFTKEDISYLERYSDAQIFVEIVYKEQEIGIGVLSLRKYSAEMLRVFVDNRSFLENQLEREER